VRQGEVLATIHAPDVAAANAQVLETHAATVLAESNARRAQSLVTEGAGSVAEQQQAEAALVQAHSEAARAIAARNALGGVHGLSDYELHSPIAGEVVERSVTVGAEVHVGQDQPLITVADLSTVWVLADVFEQDLPLIHVGDEASVDVVAFPGRRFTGRITYVSDTIDPQTRAARARIEIPNPDGALRPGMFAHVEAHGQVEGSAEVPMSAVLARRDQYFVFVHNPDGTFVQREVQLGEQHGQHVTILSGLRPGEPVVTDGAILLDAEANTAL
jgi:cobalt-zinc-cadmium efflux system membrane fusion protein